MRALAWLGLIAVAVMALSLEGRWPPVTPETATVDAQPAGGPISPGPAGGTLIFHDASQSVAGYFPKGEASLLQMFLQGEFWQELVAIAPRPFSLAYFGTTVSDVQPLVGPSSCWRARASESGKDPCHYARETNLGAVFRRIKDDLVNRRRESAIVLTDAVQSILDDTTATAANCLKGYDRRCVVDPLRDLIASDMGVWLVGIKTQFRGLVYAEVPDVTGIKEARDFSGVRPFYIVVIGADVERHRRLVTVFVHLLRELASSKYPREMKPLLEVDSVELAPGFPPPFILDTAAETLGGKFEVDDLRCRGKECTQAIRCKSWFPPATGTYAIALGPPNGGATAAIVGQRFSDWRTSVTVVEPLPKGFIPPSSALGAVGERWRARLECRSLSGPSEVRLRVRLVPHDADGPAWWKTWSTRDGRFPDVIAKTLYLAEVIKDATLPQKAERDIYSVTLQLVP